MIGSPEQFLDRTDSAAKVMAHARLLLKLSRRYEAIAPAGLGHVSRVANYKMGKVVIHADHGAAAAKLRQFSQSLRDGFLKIGLECNDIEIKVQPLEIPNQSIPSTQKPLSPAAGAALQATAASLPEDSPLRAALNKLIGCA